MARADFTSGWKEYLNNRRKFIVPLFLVGDVNIRLERTTDLATGHFMELLDYHLRYINSTRMRGNSVIYFPEIRPISRDRKTVADAVPDSSGCMLLMLFYLYMMTCSSTD